MKCSVHKQVLEYYCNEDAACICAYCRLAGEHQGHHVEKLGKASEQKKQKIKEVLSKLMKETEKMDRKVQSLQECSKKSQGKAARLRQRIIGLFNYIMIQLRDLESNIQTQVKDKLLTSVEDLIQKLEMKKDDLSRKMRYVGELCSATDPLTVLQRPNSSSYCDDEKSLDRDLYGVVDVGMDLISDTVHRLSDVITEINLCIYIQEPEDLLLNVNTAGNNLCISEDLKTVYWTDINQNRPESQERFQDYPQRLTSLRRCCKPG
ncbi:E3 ubiquitin-protein ligase TRIM15-like [Hyperolius riggenbachi]|uniref:E3 ubiquitin-protein ligase TRIM15-like n=1 Tax=Hyperolius riggenbachi TaxID=752182 RepID=UPI0035A373AB